MHARLALPCLLALAACRTAATPDPAEDVISQYGDELRIDELKASDGEAAGLGQKVTVHYTGWLTSGQTFDTSVGREPFSFRLGRDRVIKGWTQGLLGMKVGSKRRLTIPPRLAYGEKTVGPIPANSVLIFEVELMAVEP